MKKSSIVFGLMISTAISIGCGEQPSPAPKQPSAVETPAVSLPSNNSSVTTSEAGKTSVTLPGISVNTSENGSKVSIPGMEVKTENGESVSIPAVDISTDGDNSQINMEGLSVNTSGDASQVEVGGIKVNTDGENADITLPGMKIETKDGKNTIQLPGGVTINSEDAD